MPKKITVIGKISKKKHIYVIPNDRINLLDFLREKNIPVASSCYGEGVCKKCSVQLNGVITISCQINIQDLTRQDNEVIIDYI